MPEPCVPRPRSAAAPLAERLAAWADEHDGVIGRAELRALGCSRHELATARRRLRLRELWPGVWAVGHTALRRRGWRRAAVLACGDGAHLTGRTAAAMHELLATDRLEVAIPYGRGVSRLDGIDVRRSRRLPPAELAVVDGLPVVSVERAILEAVARGAGATKLLARAEELQVFDLVGLLAVLGRGRPGSAGLRRALEAYVSIEGTASEHERRFARFCDAHALPRPAMNTLVEGFLVDGAWRSAGLVLELDSWRHHGGRASFEDDRVRDLALVAAGWRVVRLTWRRLRDEPHLVAAQLRALVLCVDRPRIAARRRTERVVTPASRL